MRHDDHLAGVQAVGQLVELDEARRHPDHLVGAPRRRLDLLHRLVEQVTEDGVVLTAAHLGDGVDLGLGPVDDVVDVALTLGIPHLDDARPRLHESAQHGALVDDLGVEPGIRRGRHRLDQLVEVGLAADPGDVPSLGELIGDGDRVGRLTAAEQVEHRVEDQLVRRAVEVVSLDHLEAVGDRVLVDEHRAQHGLLGVQVLRGHPIVRRALGSAPVSRLQLHDGHPTNPSPSGLRRARSLAVTAEAPALVTPHQRPPTPSAESP